MTYNFKEQKFTLKQAFDKICGIKNCDGSTMGEWQYVYPFTIRRDFTVKSRFPELTQKRTFRIWLQ